MPVHPELLAAGLEGNGHAYDLITSWGFDRAAHIGGHKAPGVWMTGGGLRLLERGRDAVVGTDLAASNDYRGAAAAAARIACPVLFVLGDRDKMTPPRNARPLIEAIDGAKVEVIADCGHMMMIERPDETLDALEAAAVGARGRCRRPPGRSLHCAGVSLFPPELRLSRPAPFSGRIRFPAAVNPPTKA